MYRKMIVAGAAFAASAAFAQQPVSIESKIFVETFVTGKDGAIERQLKPAATVVPGDRLVYVLSYRNNGSKPVADFVITNPLPANVAFDGEESAGAEMSVDGGKNWGSLAQLTVRGPNGTSRPARRSDVTHIRWRLAGAIAPNADGQVTFRTKLN